MNVNTVNFICGRYSYLITEDTSKKHICSLIVEAFGENGSYFVKDPVRALGKTALEATVKAYKKLIESTVCTNSTQLEYVFQLGEIYANYKNILEEEPV